MNSDLYNDLCPEVALISRTTEMVEGPWQEGARLMNVCAYLFAKEVREDVCGSPQNHHRTQNVGYLTLAFLRHVKS